MTSQRSELTRVVQEVTAAQPERASMLITIRSDEWRFFDISYKLEWFGDYVNWNLKRLHYKSRTRTSSNMYRGVNVILRRCTTTEDPTGRDAKELRLFVYFDTTGYLNLEEPRDAMLESIVRTSWKMAKFPDTTDTVTLDTVGNIDADAIIEHLYGDSPDSTIKHTVYREDAIYYGNAFAASDMVDCK